MNTRAELGQKTSRRRVIIMLTLLVAIVLLIFLRIQDSRQHAVVQNSIGQAKKSEQSANDRVLIALSQAQIAESDRQEVVLFVIGLVTVMGTVVAAVYFASAEQSRRPQDTGSPSPVDGLKSP